MSYISVIGYIEYYMVSNVIKYLIVNYRYVKYLLIILIDLRKGLVLTLDG